MHPTASTKPRAFPTTAGTAVQCSAHSVCLSLPCPCRCLCLSPHCTLQVCVLEYDGAHDRLSTAASWVHPEEVWDVACCPGRPNTFVTVHRKCE